MESSLTGGMYRSREQEGDTAASHPVYNTQDVMMTAIGSRLSKLLLASFN